MNAETLTSVRELDTRDRDGVQVRLLWSQSDGRLWVSVMDTRRGQAFCLEVGEDESPTDVFHHPFAYAAHHGVRPEAIGSEPVLVRAA